MDAARVLFVCGNNGARQLPTGDDVDRITPTPVGNWPLARGVKRASCGRDHQCYVTGSGALYISGLGAQGPPRRVSFLCSDGTLTHDIPIVDVACGADYVLALDTAGRIYGAGGNDFGQLGTGLSGPPSQLAALRSERHGASEPPDEIMRVAIDAAMTTLVELPPFPQVVGAVTCVSAGERSAACVTESGDVMRTGPGLGWGWKVVRLPRDERAVGVAVSPSGAHTVVVTERGRCLGFGDGTCGQLGRLGIGKSRGVVDIDIGDAEEAVAAACGDTFTVILTSSGKAMTLGSNLMGELGRENNARSREEKGAAGPARVPPLVSITCSAWTVMGLDVQGGCWAWGKGTGTGIESMDKSIRRPARVDTLADRLTTHVATSSGHTVFVTDPVVASDDEDSDGASDEETTAIVGRRSGFKTTTTSSDDDGDDDIDDAYDHQRLRRSQADAISPRARSQVLSRATSNGAVSATGSRGGRNSVAGTRPGSRVLRDALRTIEVQVRGGTAVGGADAPVGAALDANTATRVIRVPLVLPPPDFNSGARSATGDAAPHSIPRDDAEKAARKAIDAVSREAGARGVAIEVIETGDMSQLLPSLDLSLALTGDPRVAPLIIAGGTLGPVIDPSAHWHRTRDPRVVHPSAASSHEAVTRSGRHPWYTQSPAPTLWGTEAAAWAMSTPGSSSGATGSNNNASRVGGFDKTSGNTHSGGKSLLVAPTTDRQSIKAHLARVKAARLAEAVRDVAGIVERERKEWEERERVEREKEAADAESKGRNKGAKKGGGKGGKDDKNAAAEGDDVDPNAPKPMHLWTEADIADEAARRIEASQDGKGDGSVTATTDGNVDAPFAQDEAKRLTALLQRLARTATEAVPYVDAGELQHAVESFLRSRLDSLFPPRGSTTLDWMDHEMAVQYGSLASAAAVPRLVMTRGGGDVREAVKAMVKSGAACRRQGSTGVVSSSSGQQHDGRSCESAFGFAFGTSDNVCNVDPRTRTVKQLEGFVTGDRGGSSAFTAVTGPAGSGKTSLVAGFVRALREREPHTVVVHHDCSSAEARIRGWAAVGHTCGGNGRGDSSLLSKTTKGIGNSTGGGSSSSSTAVVPTNPGAEIVLLASLHHRLTRAIGLCEPGFADTVEAGSDEAGFSGAVAEWRARVRAAAMGLASVARGLVVVFIDGAECIECGSGVNETAGAPAVDEKCAACASILATIECLGVSDTLRVIAAVRTGGGGGTNGDAGVHPIAAAWRQCVRLRPVLDDGWLGGMLDDERRWPEARLPRFRSLLSAALVWGSMPGASHGVPVAGATTGSEPARIPGTIAEAIDSLMACVGCALATQQPNIGTRGEGIKAVRAFATALAPHPRGVSAGVLERVLRASGSTVGVGGNRFTLSLIHAIARAMTEAGLMANNAGITGAAGVSCTFSPETNTAKTLLMARSRGTTGLIAVSDTLREHMLRRDPSECARLATIALNVLLPSSHGASSATQASAGLPVTLICAPLLASLGKYDQLCQLVAGGAPESFGSGNSQQRLHRVWLSPFDRCAAWRSLGGRVAFAIEAGAVAGGADPETVLGCAGDHAMTAQLCLAWLRDAVDRARNVGASGQHGDEESANVWKRSVARMLGTLGRAMVAGQERWMLPLAAESLVTAQTIFDDVPYSHDDPIGDQLWSTAVATDVAGALISLEQRRGEDGERSRDGNNDEDEDCDQAKSFADVIRPWRTLLMIDAPGPAEVRTMDAADALAGAIALCQSASLVLPAGCGSSVRLGLLELAHGRLLLERAIRDAPAKNSASSATSNAAGRFMKQKRNQANTTHAQQRDADTNTDDNDDDSSDESSDGESAPPHLLALPPLQRSLALFSRALGPGHPLVSVARVAESKVLFALEGRGITRYGSGLGRAEKGVEGLRAAVGLLGSCQQLQLEKSRVARDVRMAGMLAAGLREGNVIIGAARFVSRG